MENKKLLGSQQEFLRLKLAQARAAQAEAQAAVNIVARELGIDPNERWGLADDLTHFAKAEEKEEEQ